MKRIGVMSEKCRQHKAEISRGKKLGKGLLVLGLTVAMVCNTVDLATVSVLASGVSDAVTANDAATTKIQPTIDLAPEVRGFYGDTAADFKITKKGSVIANKASVPGKWQLTSTDSRVLQVGDIVECQLTYIPEDEEKYDRVVTYITVTVEKRPLTIYVEDMKRKYGESVMPELNFMIPDLPNNTLVAPDTVDTIRDTLIVTGLDYIAYDPEKAVGNYAFYVISSSKNYAITVKYYETLSDLTKDVKYGYFVIERKEGKITTTEDYKNEWNVQYKHDGDFETFHLGAGANHNESELRYRVTNAQKANGETIDDADVEEKLLSVSSEGTVTVKGAGSAQIEITLPKSDHYTEAKRVVDVNIAKADVTIPALTKSFLYSEEGSVSYDLVSENSLNAERLGALTYGNGTGDNTDAISGMTIQINGNEVDQAQAGQDFFKVLPCIPNTSQGAGTINCTVKSFDAYEAKTAVVNIPVESENCKFNGGNGITFNFNVVNKKTVLPKGEVKVSGTLTYGDALSTLKLKAVSFYDAADASIRIPGTLAWKEPDKILDAGTQQAAFIFTPDPSYRQAYIEYEGTATVTVNKAKAKLKKAPDPGELIYNPSYRLSEKNLNDEAKYQGMVTDAAGNSIAGTWKFTDSQAMTNPLKVGKTSYQIYFVPKSSADGGNEVYEKNYDYTKIKATVSVTVKKAVPYISVQPATAEAYTHGDRLSDQTLTGQAICGDGLGGEGYGTNSQVPVPGTFTWKNPNTQLSYTGNQGKTYEYIFTPDDTKGFTVVKGTVAVTVNKAQDPPDMPSKERNVPYSNTRVSDVKLPAGWVWDSAVLDTLLIVDTPVQALARYSAADASNYENVVVTITITRSGCEHAKTEVRDAVKATCMAEGYTGDTWCKICDTKLSDGTATPKNPKNHTALVRKVVKNPTTTEEGIMSYQCKDCGYSATKPIAKLAVGDDTSSSGSNTQPTPTLPQTPAITPAPAENPAPLPALKRPGQPSGKDKKTETGNGQQAPFIRGEDGKKGWDAIRKDTAEHAEGESIVVDMNGSSVVPGDVFDGIRGKDVTMEFDLGNGVSWQVNGKNITTAGTGDIDFGVAYGKEAADKIPVDVINALTGERSFMNVAFASEGALGFEAILRINLNAINGGLIANLFHYNDATGKLEFLSSSRIDEEGFAEFAFTQASDYTIVLDAASMEGVSSIEESSVEDAAPGESVTDSSDTAADEGNTAPTEKTDSRTVLIWVIVILGILAIVTIIGMVLVKKRKENQ